MFHIVTKLMENYSHDQKRKLHLAEWCVVECKWASLCEVPTEELSVSKSVVFLID